MNPPPGSPEPEYQQIWEEGELHRLLQHSMPKLAERLNEELANNPELSARCIDSVDQELKVDDTQSPHTNGLEVIHEDKSEQGVDCPEAEESVESLAMAGIPIEAPFQTTAAQQHNQENIPPVRGRFYSTSANDSPEPLLAPPSSPVAKHLHDSSHINGTK
ncbi:uncharacterized protein LDX57_008841 [Aspergillus melleus]|uniref:uncharacterized protein n=1 Tax=Aspergillus melleus TaxID=138277 RepID=UPI001E8DC869|nr:uncharacterized protein LDX57_008841 [Aspergillus melleus]KAH8431182.1 hypothetical protein LDX57_008841 [Aspergillus melleus]